MAAPLSLTSGWFIAPGREAETIAALRRLAWEVQANEPDTLMYLVHVPFSPTSRPSSRCRRRLRIPWCLSRNTGRRRRFRNT
jgi:hypothetical protein